MMKGRTQQILMFAAIAVVVYLLFVVNKSSNYSITEKQYGSFSPTSSIGPATATSGMAKGTGLSSSLLPREMASKEDFGQFAPEDVLKGSKSARTPLTLKHLSCGIILLSLLITCSVGCALKE